MKKGIGKAQLFRPISKTTNLSSRAYGSSRQNTSPKNQETNLTLELKTRFQKFAESAAEFYEKHSKAAPFGKEYVSALNESITTFTSFFSVLSRLVGTGPTLKQGRKPGLVSGLNAIQKASQPFLKNWKVYSDLLIVFEAPCYKPFLDHCNQYIEEIIRIQPQSIQQINAIKQQIENSFEDRQNRLKKQNTIENNIEQFFNDEQCSNDVIKLFNGVISILRESITFQSDLSVMLDDFASFQELLKYFIDQLDLKGQLVDLKPYKYHFINQTNESNEEEEQKEKKDEQKDDNNNDVISLNTNEVKVFKLDTNLELFDFINDSRQVFEPEMTNHLNIFFDSLIDCAKKYADKFNHEIDELKRTNLESVSVLTQKIDRIQADAAQVAKENMKMVQKIKQLEDEITKYKSLSIYEEVVKELINKGNENPEDVSMMTKDQMIDKIINKYQTKQNDENQEQNNNNKIEDYEKMLNSIKLELSLFGNSERMVQLSCLDLAKSANNMYKSLKEEMEKVKQENIKNNKSAAEYKDCIQQILATFEQTENKETDFLRFAIQSAKNQQLLYQNKMKEGNEQIQKQILEKLNSTILEQEKQGTIDDALNSIKNKMKNYNLFLKEIEIRLRKLVKQNISDESNQETVRNALQQVESQFNNFEDKIKEYESKFSKQKNQETKEKQQNNEDIIQILGRIQRIASNTDSVSPDDAFQKALELLTMIDHLIKEMRKETRENSTEQIQTKASLEMIYSKLKQYVGIETNNNKGKKSKKDKDDELTIPQLMHQIMSTLDALSNKMKDENSFTKEDIDKLCKETLLNPQNGLTNKENPRLYLPELCFAFNVQKESLDSIIPFNNILDELFMKFDSKFSSFKPSSDQFNCLRDCVSRLQDKLNGLAPNRVSTVVFHSLSRFISLINSFMAALAALNIDSQR